MAKNPFIRKTPKMTGPGTGGHKSAGILDDYAVRKNIDTREGTITKTPANDNDIANKKYVDDLTDSSLLDNSMADTLHRHSELSASDGSPDPALQVDTLGRVNLAYDLIVDTNLLFVDVSPGYVGIGTATPGEMLDVVGNAEINGNIIVTGTVDGIDIATDVAANTLKDTNVSTNLSAGTRAPTTIDVNSSDGTNATLVEADTTNAGILGSDKWDEIVAATSHVGDNTQAHTDYLLNSGADIATGPITITADNSSADTAYVPMVLYNTDDTPPAASGFPVGTLYVQYTA